MTTMRRLPSIPPFLAGLLVPVAVLAIAYLAMLLFAPKDAASVADQDLMPSLERLPEQENAVFLFGQARAKYSDQPDNADFFFADTTLDLAKAKNVLANNQGTLALIEQALAKAQARSLMRDPQFSSLNADSLAALGKVFNSGNAVENKFLQALLLLRAEVALAEGRATEAASSFGQALRLVSLLQNNQGPVLDQLTAFSFYGNASKRIVLSLKAAAWAAQPQALAQLALLLAQYRPRADGLRESYRSEYLFAKILVFAVNTGGIGQLRSLITNDSDSLLAPIWFISALMSFTPRNYWIEPNNTAEKLYGTIKPAFDVAGRCENSFNTAKPNIDRSIIAPNLVGRQILVVLASSYDSIHNTFCKQQAEYRQLQVLLALRRYQITQQQLPFTLTVLVPQYLEQSTLTEAQVTWDGKTLKDQAGQNIALDFGVKLP
jgi:hypothetical protein